MVENVRIVSMEIREGLSSMAFTEEATVKQT